MSPSEQAPRPRGSPQEPQPPLDIGAGELADPLADTANTLSCGLNFLLSHLGHFALPRPKTKASNSCWHSWQTYSKIGISIAPVGLIYPIRINSSKLRKRKGNLSSPGSKTEFETALAEKPPGFASSTFHPHPWLRGGHVQTLAAFFLSRRIELPPAERRLIEVEPGIPVLCHCHWQKDRP